MSKRYWRWGRS